jgi:hypothetical protein
MAGIPLVGSACVLWHGVDAIELSWTVPCRRRLPEDPPDRLEQQLEVLKRQGAAQRQRIESGWFFTGDGEEPDPLMVHTQGLLGAPYALQCAAFLLRVNHESSTRPRAMLQLRSHFIQQVGAREAVRRVCEWTTANLLDLIDGRVDLAEPVWSLHRVDLAADVAGIALTRHHLPRFVTRARERTEWQDAGVDGRARVRLAGRALTGFTFGARGGTYARVYDKTRQSSSDAPIRAIWAAAGYDAERDGTVWRVEVEMRRRLLHELHGDDTWVPDSPQAVIDGYLTALWRYGVGRWLRLHEGVPTESHRPPVEPWWAALAALDFDSGPAEGIELRRRKPPATDTARLSASLTGTLTSLAAAWRITDIDGACAALAAHLHLNHGDAVFARRVRERVERWPVPVPVPSLPHAPRRAVVGDVPAGRRSRVFAYGRQWLQSRLRGENVLSTRTRRPS